MRRRKNLLQFKGKVIVLEGKSKKTKLSKQEKHPTILLKKKTKRDSIFWAMKKVRFFLLLLVNSRFFENCRNLDKKISVKTLERMKSPQDCSRCGPWSHTTEEDKLIFWALSNKHFLMWNANSTNRNFWKEQSFCNFALSNLCSFSLFEKRREKMRQKNFRKNGGNNEQSLT